MENTKKNAYKLLRAMSFNRRINASVIRAVKVRLEYLLEEHERKYRFFEEHIAHKLNPTRVKNVRRRHQKVITAFKITIYELTPWKERTEEEPQLLKRGGKNRTGDGA